MPRRLLLPFLRWRERDPPHPYEIYLLGFAFASSLPSALGLTSPPPSVAALMEAWAARVWVVLLVVGCLVALLGLMWPGGNRRMFIHGRAVEVVSVDGLLLEMVGLVVVAVATGFYGFAAVYFTGWTALPPAGIVLGFGVASAAVAVLIWRRLRRLKPAPDGLDALGTED